MKKTNLICFIGIGLLAFLPFIRSSVGAPPCWVGVYEDEYYEWQYNNHTATVQGQWLTDGVALAGWGATDMWMGWPSEGIDYFILPGIMSHTINTVGDVAPDVEYLSNYDSVQVIHAMNFSSTNFAGDFDWADKDTGLNVWNGLIIENSTEFAYWHSNLTLFFDLYSIEVTTMWASTQLDWTEVVATANIGLASVNVTAAALTNGFTLTVDALGWGVNTLAVVLTVTFEDGLLDTWDLAYGGNSVMDVELVKGSAQFAACPTPAPGIPGFEIPIIIGVAAASTIGLILFKKHKNK
ncbi:hypothetical protein LCGC14_1809970 [marine sediment metagenome]|uniref:Uncharacterized protein n=1 Tax=marine sediment metagenome TaxID=412755 RepID=A0A0F9GM83_9ZZZZ